MFVHAIDDGIPCKGAVAFCGSEIRPVYYTVGAMVVTSVFRYPCVCVRGGECTYLESVLEEQMSFKRSKWPLQDPIIDHFL